MAAQSDAQLQTEVLIVGAGPVGLSLAIELGRRGIKTLLVEQNDRVGYQPRAKTTNVRSMEHMRRWGLAEKIRAASPLPPDYPTNVLFATRLFGYPLTLFENAFFGRRERHPLFSEPAQWIPQYTVEAVLRDYANTLPTVSLTWNTRLESASQSHETVTAEVTDLATERRQAIRARYLVGADGGRSTVRQILGVHMSGQHGYAHNLNAILRAPGLGAAHGQERAIMYWLVNPDSPALLAPMDRGDTWSFSIFMPKGVTEISETEMLDRIRKAIGRDFAFEVLIRDYWSAHRLIADRYRVGRILLAGDACHLHPPMGGYGMNMGIGDAVDLGWKLGATLRNWAGPGLLDSYERERAPVHRRVIEEAVQNHAVLPTHLVRDDLESPGPDGENARRLLGEEIQRSKIREFNTLGVVLGCHYAGSPIVVPDGTEPPEEHFMRYEPSAHPGCLAPHLWLEDGASLYDRFGGDFTLLVAGSKDDDDASRAASAARERGMPLAITACADRRLRDLYGARLALIRPDQHVAWRGDALPADAGAVLDVARGAVSDVKRVAAAG